MQRLFGAEDLDIGPVANGRGLRLPRLYIAANQAVHTDLAISRGGWTNEAGIRLEVSGPDGGGLADHMWRADSGRGWEFRTDKAGWHTLELSGTGLPKTTPFELEVAYTAPRTL